MNDLQRKALSYFISMGWSAPQSAGIVANLWTESRLNPAAVGDGGQAYGIAQWHPDRQQNFASIMGKDIRGSSLEEQLAFVHAELQGAEKAAGNALQESATAEAAGAAISMLYERPADRKGEASRRGALAAALSASYAPESPQSAPAPAPVPTPQPASSSAPMPILAILSALGPILGQFIPQIAKALKPESISAAHDAQTAQLILNTVAQAAGVLQPGADAGMAETAAAVDKMQADPALVKTVTQAVVNHPQILPLVEVGGGPAQVRKDDLAAAITPGYKLSKSAVFVMSIILLPMCYWFVGSLIAGGADIPSDWPWYAQVPFKLLGSAWNPESRSGGFNLVIGMVLGGIVGVYYGVSVTQQKREAAAAAGTPSNDSGTQ